MSTQTGPNEIFNLSCVTGWTLQGPQNKRAVRVDYTEVVLDPEDVIRIRPVKDADRKQPLGGVCDGMIPVVPVQANTVIESGKRGTVYITESLKEIFGRSDTSLRMTAAARLVYACLGKVVDYQPSS